MTMVEPIARRGLCLVLAAAPGAGKTSVSRALLGTEPELSLSISDTQANIYQYVLRWLELVS